MDDKDIITLYLQRDERAVIETCNKYDKYCKTISYNILKDRETVEECVNDAYLCLWDRIPPAEPTDLSAYLGRIVRNISLKRYTHDKAEKRGGKEVVLALGELEDCISSDDGVEAAVTSEELMRAIEEFLRSQSKEKRVIFVRRYWYLASIKDIAKAYGMTSSKVASLLFRMRNDLKTYLTEEGISL